MGVVCFRRRARRFVGWVREGYAVGPRARPGGSGRGDLLEGWVNTIHLSLHYKPKASVFGWWSLRRLRCYI